MNILLFIQSLSILIWILPPVRQYKTPYFLFFVVLALSDPILYTMYCTLGIEPLKFYPFMTFLLIISLSNIGKKRFWIISAVFILIISFAIQSEILWLYYFCIILFSIVLFIIIYQLIQLLMQKRILNLFLCLLLFYALLNMLKLIAMSLNLYQQGIISYYLTTFIQIFFGILFSFITINTKSFSILPEP